MIKHYEVKTYTYKGISVLVEINYEKGTVSLSENIPGFNKTHYLVKEKSWVFAGRTLDYMNSWLAILDAMKYAVTEAKKELERDLAEKSAFKGKLVDEAIKKIGGVMKSTKR